VGCWIAEFGKLGLFVGVFWFCGESVLCLLYGFLGC